MEIQTKKKNKIERRKNNNIRLAKSDNTKPKKSVIWKKDQVTIRSQQMQQY